MPYDEALSTRMRDALAPHAGISDKTALAKFRDAMAGPKGAELMALTQDLRAKGLRIGQPDLKRVPPGYDRDHPNGDMLRHKGYGVWTDKPDTAFFMQSILVARTREEFQFLLPAFTFLSELG